MKLIRIKAVMKKELLQILRDPFSLAIAFLAPVILLVIFGYAITLDVNDIPTIVQDQDKSQLSREWINELEASGYFSIHAYIQNYDDLNSYLDSRKAKVAVVIPYDFSENIRSKQDAEIQIIVDGSDSNTANIAQGYILALSEIYSQRISGSRVKPIIDFRARVWYNPELKSRNFIIPGLIAVIMAIIIALLTSLTVAREWERGTMEQLISTPLKTPELIIGKLIPYFMIGFTDTVLSILMTTLLFEVPLKGSLILLLSLSSLFLFGGLSFGIMISILAKSQIIASQIAIISTFLPAFLLSGFMFAIANMPKPLQLVTYIFPARYFVSILKGIFLKGSPFHFLILETSLLAVYGILVFVRANKKFEKRIAS